MDIQDTPGDLKLEQALTILTMRRKRNILDAFIALDLAADMLNVVREDALAAQVLDIKSTFKSRIKQEDKNAIL